MTSSYDIACDLIRKSLDLKEGDIDNPDNIEAIEDKIPMFKWMYRNNVDRDDVRKYLDILVANGSLPAAKAIIELRFDKSEDGSTGDAFRSVSGGS